MATVASSLTWTDAEPEVRTGLGIECGDDARLARIFAAAVSAADAYLSNSFTDSDGADIALPAEILEGVIAYMHALWHTTGATSPQPGLTSVKTGDLSESYGSSGSAVSPAMEARSRAAAFWAPWRCAVWR